MSYSFENLSFDIRTLFFQKLSPIPHFHSHLQLVYMAKGSSVVKVDYKDFLIEEGDLFISFPYQLCFYSDKCSCNGYIISVPYDFYPELKKILQENIPLFPLINKNQLSHQCKTLINYIMSKNSSNSHFDKIVVNGYLLALLGEILPLITLQPCQAGVDILRDILIFCTKNYTEPLTLDSIANEFHLNKYYLSHVFNERVHLTLPAFINQLRIEHACNLMRIDNNITEIAYSSGFSSIRTFNRVFAQTYSMTPREYIRLQKQEFMPLR